MEDNYDSLKNNYEINYASGVLNIQLGGGAGTWVLNKQTPNRQIWWSSPMSGPRRYEWDEKMGKWVWTKYVDYVNSGGSGSDNGSGWKESITLGDALKTELVELGGFQIHSF